MVNIFSNYFYIYECNEKFKSNLFKTTILRKVLGKGFRGLISSKSFNFIKYVDNLNDACGNEISRKLKFELSLSILLGDLGYYNHLLILNSMKKRKNWYCFLSKCFF